MTDWVNFAEIRAKVSLSDVIFRYYRIDSLTKEGDKLVGPCPVHSGDSPRAFHADLAKNIWHCFSRCKKGGNQLDFVAAKESISIRDAALRLKGFFLDGVVDSAPPGALPPPATVKANTDAPLKAVATTTTPTPMAAREPDRNPRLDLKLPLHPDHPHLLSDRNLQLSTTEHFDVGYCPAGILRGMIAIPIHDEDGQLVAYAGRRLKPQDIREHGKYKLPKGFRKELVLFNLHRAKGEAAEKGLILVEGFFSVLKLYEAGITNVVAAMGCEISEYQAKQLASAKEVVLLFDGDEAGRTGAEQAREKLKGVVPVRFVRLPDNTKPDDLSPRALRWLVNGVRELGLSEVAFWVTPTEPPPAPTQ